MKKTNRAFTLTELLVALGVISILCAVLLPVIFNIMPNQNIIMAKRAYYTIQTVISEMLNDEACYPDKTNSVSDPRVGLDDGKGYLNCTPWHDVSPSATQDAKTKFIYVFKDKLGKFSYDPSVDNSGVRFSTEDGMDWAFSAFNFTNNTNTNAVKITVDVNGQSAPNCGHKGVSYVGELGSGSDSACKNRENGFDRFQVTVRSSGQVTINSADVWAVNAVKVNRNITSDKNSNAEDE